VKLHFLLARRNPPVPSEIILEVSEILARRGFQVKASIAEEILSRPDHLDLSQDLYLLKSYTELSLSMAGILHAQGARLLNPYLGCIASRDKIVAAQRLYAAGIPAPRTWVTGDLTLLRSLVDEMPLIIKPYLGWRGTGIRIVRNQDELAAVPSPERPVVVQEYLAGTGEDLRLYVAGDQVFATRKPFSPTSYAEPGRLSSVSPELREMALRCGRAFGLGLYGMDLIETADGPRVVDVNYFPGYKGIPNAPLAVADYIDRYANRQCDLQCSELSGNGMMAALGSFENFDPQRVWRNL
jgi:ribosomal protein S6--L-glutamate ligase